MNKIENFFDINIILMTLSSSVAAIRDEKNIELIYDMEATIPRELRGDSIVLLRLLIKMLTFVFENTDKKEILLSLGAPTDFLFEELMSFMIKETHIAKEKVLEFLETNLSKDLEILEGKIVYEKTADIHLEIPFKINELGYRRHYRLPDRRMLSKKVLLFCLSEQVAQSIKRMFKYFFYDVDVGFEVYKSQGNNIALYDILIVEDCLITDTLNETIMKVQENIPLSYVILGDSYMPETELIPSVTTHLIRPVMQESIFDLIVSLCKHEKNQTEIKSDEKKIIVDIEKYLQVGKETPKNTDTVQGHLHEGTLQSIIEKKNKLVLAVLDKVEGEQNTKKMGLGYKNELKNFLDTFDHSDIYFRQIANQKATNKIKQFCIDLEKQSKIIGAKSMLKFTDIINLIFIYNKFDMLPIYSGRYHIELEKLIKEIKNELGIKELNETMSR